MKNQGRGKMILKNSRENSKSRKKEMKEKERTRVKNPMRSKKKEKKRKTLRESSQKKMKKKTDLFHYYELIIKVKLKWKIFFKTDLNILMNKTKINIRQIGELF